MSRFVVQTLALAIFCLPWVSLADGTMTTTSNPTTAGPASFPTITDTEGTGSLVGGAGSDVGGAVGGASGGNGGAFQLSTGAVVGISVACGLVVLAIISLWGLWFVAKRQQWTLRETLSRASRRLTGRKVPPTPRTPGAPKSSNKRQATMYGTDDLEKGATASDRSRSVTPPMKKPAIPTQSKFDTYMGRK